ncbi:glutathione binding-like protein, partial [Pseudomonas aeruginosa]|uniref:glutathione binding-like protein n=1 Tax=Pseudomonas aeruginosa TaxID=287 RepID=UPI002E775074
LLADGRPYILDDEFTVADAHLFALTRWCALFGISLTPFPALMDFMARIAARPAVRAALQAEGLEEHPDQC